jgi:hypothetical protein
MVMEDVIIQSEERNRFNGIMEKLFSGRYSDPQMLWAEINKLGFFLPLPCRVLYFYKTEPSGLHRIVDSVSPLHCSFGSEMAAIIGNTGFEEKITEIGMLAEKEHLYVTHGNYATTIQEIPSNFFQAKETMKWLKEIGGKEGVYSYEEILLNLTLKRLRTFDEAQLLATRFWEPLLKDGSRRVVPLNIFVEELIRNTFNLRATALTLNIHYNTGRNYLEEVQNILNLRLDETNHRLILMLARQIAMEKGQ